MQGSELVLGGEGGLALQFVFLGDYFLDGLDLLRAFLELQLVDILLELLLEVFLLLEGRFSPDGLWRGVL